MKRNTRTLFHKKAFVFTTVHSRQLSDICCLEIKNTRRFWCQWLPQLGQAVWDKNHLTILIQRDWLHLAGAVGATLVSKFIRNISRRHQQWRACQLNNDACVKRGSVL
jgi:hypothetical protein